MKVGPASRARPVGCRSARGTYPPGSAFSEGGPCFPCSVSYILHSEMSAFGDYIRQRREELRGADPRFSLRRVAASIGVEPSYLSKVERGEQPPPSEETVVALAKELGEDPDVLLAL